jgi:hypothetical protein
MWQQQLRNGQLCDLSDNHSNNVQLGIHNEKIEETQYPTMKIVGRGCPSTKKLTQISPTLDIILNNDKQIDKNIM